MHESIYPSIHPAADLEGLLGGRVLVAATGEAQDVAQRVVQRLGHGCFLAAEGLCVGCVWGCWVERGGQAPSWCNVTVRARASIDRWTSQSRASFPAWPVFFEEGAKDSFQEGVGVMWCGVDLGGVGYYPRSREATKKKNR